MPADVRKYVHYVEEIHREGGRAAERPILMIAAAAVIANPWAGRGFVEDLRPEIRDQAPGLGAELTRRILELAGSGDAVEAYGKAAVVGLDGEVEHASAIIHTLRFGNYFRKAVGAETYLAFTNTRGAAGSAIQVPLMHKHDAGARSHYLTVDFRIPDAPAAGEIVVALGAATGGRAHPRIGDRYQDLKELEDAGEETVVSTT
jgi:hypothetical protein